MRSIARAFAAALALLAAPLAETAEGAPSERAMCAVADCMSEVVEMLEKQGWLGLELEGIPSRGLRVARVVERGPAAAAGLRVGDLVLAIGGEQVDVRRPETLQPLLAKSRPGEVTELRIRRGEVVRNLRLTAGRFPPERLAEAIGAYVLSAVHLCHHPDHETFGDPPPGVGKRDPGRR